MRKLLYLVLLLMPFSAFTAEYYIYLDGMEVRTPIKENELFLGFSRNIDARCDNGSALNIYKKSDTGKNSCWLCGLYEKAETLKNELVKYDSEINSRNLFINKISDISVDPKSGVAKLEAIKDYMVKLSLEVNSLNTKKDDVSNKLSYIQSVMAKGMQTDEPFYADKGNCDNARLGYDGFDWGMINSLDINKNKATAGIKAAMVNRTGVDVKDGTIYLIEGNRSENISIPVFSPWEVSVYEREKYNRNMYMEKAMPKAMMEVDEKLVKPVPKKVSREKAFVYKLDGFSIPSDGNIYEYELVKNDVKIEEKLFVLPYRDTRVYRKVAFKPSFEISGSEWRLNYGKESFDSVYSTIEDGKVVLAAGYDREIIVKREKDLSFTDQDGFFGSEKRIKRAYVITVNNIAKESKTVEILDRIPVSTDKRIVVKDIKINGEVYKPESEYKGGVKLEAVLKAGEVKKFRIEFTVITDKELDINL